MSKSRYTDEFKAEAVGQILERGHSVASCVEIFVQPESAVV